MSIYLDYCKPPIIVDAPEDYKYSNLIIISSLRRKFLIHETQGFNGKTVDLSA